MVEKKSLNVKIPMDLYEKIEGSGRTQVAIIEEALRKYFDSEKVVDTTKQVEDLKKEVIQLTERISSKDNEIMTLNESIGRAYNETRWFQEEIRRVNDRILALLAQKEKAQKSDEIGISIESAEKNDVLINSSEKYKTFLKPTISKIVLLLLLSPIILILFFISLVHYDFLIVILVSHLKI